MFLPGNCDHDFSPFCEFLSTSGYIFTKNQEFFLRMCCQLGLKFYHFATWWSCWYLLRLLVKQQAHAFPKHKFVFKLKKKTEVVYIIDVFRHKLSNCGNKERDPLIVRLGIKWPTQILIESSKESGCVCLSSILWSLVCWFVGAAVKTTFCQGLSEFCNSMLWKDDIRAFDLINQSDLSDRGLKQVLVV